MRKFYSLSVACIVTVLCLFGAEGRGQSISLATMGNAYTQNFNTLSNTAATTTNNLAIAGWYMTESGGGARDNEQYAVDPGSSSTGDTYSYGAAGNTDRALGSIRSGTLIPIIGASFTNNTGSTINTLTISYTGEQWRIGNTAAARDDRMDFQYSLTATDLTTGTWADVNPLDFTNVIKTAGAAGALDGNNAANRTNISFTITGLNIANGSTFWIRWTDLDAPGADDGLAIDDFSLTPGSSINPSVAISDGSIGSGNVSQGDLNVILQRFDLAVTDADATINGLTVTTAGTYTASDISNLKVRYSADVTLDAGDATLSTKTLSLGTGSHVFPSFSSQVINTGSTGYIFVTADISGTATAGNTINIATTAFSNISFSGTVNKTGTDPVTAGGAKTFLAVTPDVTLSSPNPSITAGNITQGATNNVLYRFDLAVTTANATLNGVTITTSGTYVASDLTNLKCWYSSDNSFNSGTDVLLSTKTLSLGAGTQVFPSFSTQLINSGSTGYIFITADIPCGAVNTNTIAVDAITTTDISFVSANKSGTAFAGGAQTITSATPNNVTGAAASNLNQSSSVSWTNATGCYDEVMIVVATSANNGTPTGDGSAYTANLAFGSGTALGNGYVVYKGASSPQVVTALTNGTTYNFKIFTRNDENWSSGVEVTATPVQEIQSGEILINQFSPDYGNASDEYVELVNTTSRSIDLSGLKLNYRSASGGGSNSTTLSGTILPHSFWLLASNATVSVGQTSLSRDGSFTSGFAGSDGQIALLRVSDDFKIDGLGYGTLTGGTYAEGTTAANPSTDGGLRRVTDGADNGTNSTDFTTVSNANIYLRNSNSRLANTGASIATGTYTDISVTGNSSMGGNVTVSNRLTLTSGNFSIGSNTFTLNGSVTRTSGFLDGTSSSNLVLGGATSQSISFATNGSLNNLTMNKSGGTATLGTALKVYGVVSWTDINGTLAIGSSNLVLKSDASGTARIDQVPSGKLTGGTNVTIERYIPAKRAWRLLTAPLTGSSNNSVFYNWQNNGVTGSGVEIWGPGGSADPSNGNGLASGSAASIRKYSASGWTNITDTKNESLISATGNNAFAVFVTGPFQNGSGNIATGSAATTLSATGTLRTGAVSFTNIATSNHTMIGNPYASPVDLDAAITAGTNLQQFAWFWDPQLGTVGGYTTYDVSANSYSDISGSFTNATVLQSGQAFFVKATGAAGTLNFTEANKTTTSTNAVFRTANGIEIFRTKLSRINAGTPLTVDAVMNVYNAGDNAAVDAGDASKFSNPAENMSILRNGSYLSVEHRPVISANDTIFLTLWNMTATNYRFAFTAENMSSSGLSAFLEDAYLNTSTPVSLNGNTVEVDFAVTSNAATTGNRFRIVFRPTTTLPVAINNIKAFEKGNAIAVEWSNSSETNVERYEVERSSDGKNFNKAATVTAKANNGSAVNYQWIDNNPLGTTNYYRIKVLAAGDNKYSSIVKVNLQKGTTSISLYPNPVKGESVQLQLSNLAKGQYTITIYNSAGQKVYQRSLQHNGGSASETISLGNTLPSGSYVLRLTGSDIDLNQRIIIEKP